jgi:type I restriction enzyme S subunit
MRQGWQIKKLGELCGFIRGPFGGSLKKNIFKDTGYAVYEQSHAIYDQFTQIRYFIDKEKFDGMKRFELHPGELIMSCSGTMGKVAIVPDNIQRGIINQALLKLSPNKTLSNRYLKLWMASSQFQDSLQKHSQGAAIQNVASVQILKEIEISLPPLPEQHRIVAILDEVFDSITRAKDIAERNLRNAREVFESYLRSIFTYPAQGWEERRLEDIIRSNDIGITKNSGDQGREKGYKYVKMNNITKTNTFDFTNFTCVDATPLEVQRYQLKHGDFLFNTRNSHELVGKTCVYETITDEPVLYNNNIMRIRFKSNVNPYFINYAFSSEIIIDRLEKLKSGTTNVSAIYFKDLKNLPLPIPVLSIQEDIVDSLHSITSEVKKLSSLYQQKLSDLEELKKSVLQKAFNGELTA